MIDDFGSLENRVKYLEQIVLDLQNIVVHLNDKIEQLQLTGKE
jgi:hypothetical protein